MGGQTVLVLAPLSVKPEFQRQVVGPTLIRRAHRLAKELGYQYSLVLGSGLCYPKFGYIPAEQLGVTPPEGIPSANLMAVKLQKSAKPLSGTVTYAKEFGL